MARNLFFVPTIRARQLFLLVRLLRVAPLPSLTNVIPLVLLLLALRRLGARHTNLSFVPMENVKANFLFVRSFCLVRMELGARIILAPLR